MKLEEKFGKVGIFFEGKSILIEEDEFNNASDQCVTIADTYAEEFGKWLRENDKKSLMISDLLQIFYNERKL